MQKNIDNTKKKKRKASTERKQSKWEHTKKNRLQTFADVKACSMVRLSILETLTCSIFKEEFEFVIREGPLYVCDTC